MTQDVTYEFDSENYLLLHRDGRNGNARKHCWDEENRLAFTRNEKENIFGYYVYDAGGERGCKMNGEVVSHNINGQWYYDPVPSMVTLYASPYLVADFRGYTKHYYAGTERVASKLGGGGLVSIDRPVGDVAAKHVAASDPHQQFWSRCAGMSKPCSTYLHQVLYAHSAILCPESDLYFYHGDHLGSASWITDARGDAIQHLQYLPFGETRVDQRTSYWNSRYSFSGKEKDEESGYSYFGARYYDSDLSIWLSVDPLSDKYPFISPYVYCVNNPIKYWDPDGRWIPGLDENGNTTYTAEKGDNLHTFQKQFGVGKKEALSIFNQSKISTADNDRFAAGQHVIKGDIVKEYTGSDVLKGQWHNLTNTQKAAQIMFGMMYSEYHNQTADNGTYSMNINDFVDGFYVGSSGLNLNNVQIPAKGGGTIQIDQMSISPSSTIGNPPLIYHGAYGGNEQSRTDGSTFASYHFMSARNKNATHSFKVINISVPTGSNNNKFRKSY